MFFFIPHLRSTSSPSLLATPFPSICCPEPKSNMGLAKRAHSTRDAITARIHLDSPSLSWNRGACSPLGPEHFSPFPSPVFFFFFAPLIYFFPPPHCSVISLRPSPLQRLSLPPSTYRSLVLGGNSLPLPSPENSASSSSSPFFPHSHTRTQVPQTLTQARTNPFRVSAAPTPPSLWAGFRYCGGRDAKRTKSDVAKTAGNDPGDASQTRDACSSDGAKRELFAPTPSKHSIPRCCLSIL